MFGEHLSPIRSLMHLYLPNGVMMVQESWLLFKLKHIVLHTNVKFSKKLVPGMLAQNVHDYRQRILLMSYDFVQLTWVADPAYSVVFLFESLQMDLRYWMRHKRHRLGIWINVNVRGSSTRFVKFSNGPNTISEWSILLYSLTTWYSESLKKMTITCPLGMSNMTSMF